MYHRLTSLVILIACLSSYHAWGVTHFYDADKRLIRTVYSLGSATLYTYDEADNLLTVAVEPVPIAPIGLTVTLSATTSATLGWEDRSTTELGYRVERRLATSYVWEFVADLPPSTTEFTDSTLASDLTYVYRVFALGPSPLTSAYSIEVTAAGEYSEAFSIATFVLNDDIFEIHFEAAAASTYTLESSLNLETDSWSPLNFALSPNGTQNIESISATNGNIVIYFSIPEDEVQFYRIRKDT